MISNLWTERIKWIKKRGKKNMCPTVVCNFHFVLFDSVVSMAGNSRTFSKIHQAETFNGIGICNHTFVKFRKMIRNLIMTPTNLWNLFIVPLSDTVCVCFCFPQFCIFLKKDDMGWIVYVLHKCVYVTVFILYASNYKVYHTIFVFVSDWKFSTHKYLNRIK